MTTARSHELIINLILFYHLKFDKIACAVLVVKDDDFGFEDYVLGVADIEFATAEFIKTPRVAQDFSIKLQPGDSLGNVADHTVSIS